MHSPSLAGGSAVWQVTTVLDPRGSVLCAQVSISGPFPVFKFKALWSIL